ncbi:NAD(P)-binding protein [Fistulina hepatica ATCC 64428]|uniref:NAD(P)-binding protein n=1 Tax=Fistulina hepatica ATCC 64428 TaxID=1128425 RepID=A0A0D7AJ04_9AGAR|nr:NAD(P)-binding protein [Fistulina hepatica ATCC 64428]
MEGARKIVICGAGFLGSHIARCIKHSSPPLTHLQITSRKPAPERLPPELAPRATVSYEAADVTSPSSLSRAFRNADVVVSLVGLMHGDAKQFENIQWKGAENVAAAAREANAKVIHISAIGADADSHIPYVRTKALGEMAVLNICPTATIIRPSLVFGPEDDFFNRFARLSKVLPFIPVFGGGVSLFQPVYVGDIARAVEIISRTDPEIESKVSGKIFEAGGPEVFTYRELVEKLLRYTHRRRPIISLPFWVGTLQGLVLEQLPLNLFTITRSQVEQLKFDNIVSPPKPGCMTFQELVERYSPSNLPLKRIDEILPTYLK